MPTENDLNYWVHITETFLPWLGMTILAVIVSVILVRITLDLLDMRRLGKQKAIFIELTPPAANDKVLAATRQLFSVLHGLEESRSMLDKILRHKMMFSFEIVATKKQGIRYMLHANENDAPTIEQTIMSYLPDAKFQRVDDYMPNVDGYGRVLEIKQTGHFAYPLQAQGDLEQHDPIAYLTGAMTKLAPDELIALQIVVVPTKVNEAYTISKRLLHNEELISQLGRRKIPVLGAVFSVINAILFAIMDAIGDMVSGSPSKGYMTDPTTQHKYQAAMKIKPARALSQIEQKLAEAAHYKLNQPLFSVNLRALIVVRGKAQEKQRVKGIYDWLALFRTAKYQTLKPRFIFLFRLQREYRFFAFKHRLPSIFRGNANIFSSSEIADLYHFPHAETTKTEDIVKSLSHTLPAPLSQKNGDAHFDVVLGSNSHHGSTTPIGLTEKERERHVYIIGGTGNGKTTMLQYAIVQDIRHGKGLAVVDPHGDLAETILHYVPKLRIEDVIYFNPDDLSHPIGMNLLELTPGLDGDDLLREKDLITESVISIFRKIFSDQESGGHRIEYVLRNTIHTALTQKDATLFTIFNLLNDPKYRRKVIKDLDDEDLKNFWRNELGKAGDMQRVKMVAGITAKIGRFLFSASARRILEQPKSTIDFDDIINSGKILICNFSKGIVGEDTSELLGITVLAKLQLASLRRARLSQDNRRPFYLYVDEFQNFATLSFVQMLSEARKYKLFLLMAEQSTSQQEEQRLVNIILANVGTVICFRSGNPADEQAVLPMFMPYIEAGEIANLPSYTFYARVAAGVQSQEPMSGETLLIDDRRSDEIANRVIESSRILYAKKVEVKPGELQATPVKKAKTTHQPKKSHATKKASDDLSELKPVA